MVAGVPAVATRARVARAGALHEVLGDAACLVAPGDAEALAGALAPVLGDAEVRAGRVARRQEQASRFSWEQCAPGRAAMYRRAVAH